MTQVCISRIATATPPHDVHESFAAYVIGSVKNDRTRALLRHMAQRSGIDHRFSFVKVDGETATGSVDGHTLFGSAGFPATRERMEIFELFAPRPFAMRLGQAGSVGRRAERYRTRDRDLLYGPLRARSRFCRSRTFTA